MKCKYILHILVIAPFLCISNYTCSEVINFNILSVESPTFDGRQFGEVGQYKKITAKATIAVDPQHRLNQGIVDIDIAPVNSDGLVEAVADVVILMPMDLEKGNKRIERRIKHISNRQTLISIYIVFVFSSGFSSNYKLQKVHFPS